MQRPVIAVEEKGHGERYGHPNGAIAEHLKSFGYKQVDSFMRDKLFKVPNA
jgi:hypothetical protein